MTPGPWELDTAGWPLIVNGPATPGPFGTHEGPSVVCTLETNHRGRSECYPADTALANGRAIAALPALIEACRAVVDRWESGDLAEAARMCEAAIELARKGDTD